MHALDSGSGETSHRALDRGEPGGQRSSEGISTGTVKQGKYNDADNSPDDHVLERHHAGVVRAQTMQRFRGLDVILQHMRNFLLLDSGGYGHRSHGLVKPATNLVQIYFVLFCPTCLDAGFARAFSG